MKNLGYIKFEDVMELIKLIHRVHMETNHFIAFRFSDTCINVYGMLGGFNKKRKFDFDETLYFYDPFDKQREIEQFCTIRNYLRELLGESNA